MFEVAHTLLDRPLGIDFKQASAAQSPQVQTMIESAFHGAFLQGKKDVMYQILKFGQHSRMLMGVPRGILRVHLELILNEAEQFTPENTSIYRTLIQNKVLLKDDTASAENESDLTKSD